MNYEIIGYDENGAPIQLYECETLDEARDWVENYTSRYNAGGYDSITCNAIPFTGDFEFSWTREDGEIV